MTEFREIARAKINLTLRVHGRRPDGYHELESIVVFADVGERLRLVMHDESDPRPFMLRVFGPYAREIIGQNLIATAVDLLEQASGCVLACDIELEKTMPVASGIGGGSADAAAALRAIRMAHPFLLSDARWNEIAARLGADVPVCVASRSSLMCGSGDRLSPISVPALDVVLANAHVDVPADKTRQVFRALAAKRLNGEIEPATPTRLDRTSLISFMKEIGNDLEAPATAVVPMISSLKKAVADQQGCDVAVLSGAGPTVVGVFEDAVSATAAAERLRAEHPDWWVQAGRTGVP